jgi:glutamine amidotransferase-like uncharacterized protein
MKPRIALFKHHPECSRQCCEGMIRALDSHYDIQTFSREQCTPDTLSGVDVVAFPGGIGDADSYFEFFPRRAGNAVADFVDRGGHYLGICMGAYWAAPRYFDILQGVDAVQYIRRPGAEIRRSYGTVAKVTWLGEKEHMFFYDGCALLGDSTQFETIATYANGDAMAIIQNRVGVIGCHPESELSWYEKPYAAYARKHWHEWYHHHLLLAFVDRLIGR